MRSDSLWPVLGVLGALLAGVGAVEWVAANREARVEVIQVVSSAGAEFDLEQAIEAPWQATEPTGPEHERARQLLRRGEVAEALAAYAGLVDAPDVPVALLTEYAYALRRAEQCTEAQVIVSRAAERAPNDGAVALASALTYRCLQQMDAARAEFERAVTLRPNHHPTRLAYGDFLQRQGDLNRAVAVLEPASRAGNNDERARALAALGLSLFQRGDFEPARAALSDAVERAPSSVAIWMSVARTYLGSDKPADHQLALAYAEQATRLAPSVAAPYSALGRAHEKLGMTLEAIESYRRAAELDSGYRYVRERLVRLALEEEEYDLALKSARELLELEPARDEYQFLNGLASARAGDVDGARASYQEAIRLREGAYAEAWFNLGILEREAGNLNEALIAYQRAVTTRSDYETAWNNMGLVQYDLGRFNEAIAAFRAALAVRDTYASAWSNMGRSYAALDDYEQASLAYERALELDPTDRVVRLRLAAAYRRIGRVAESIEFYRALVADEPRYVAAWYNLGIALANSAREDEAVEAYQTALGIDPTHYASIKNLGLLEARIGRPTEAMTHLSDALDRDPADIEVRIRLAELARDAGDRARCAREAGVVLAQQPGHAAATALQSACAR